MVNVAIDKLFEKIGRLYIENRALSEELAKISQALTETSRKAGEALHSLEALGHKEVADAIQRGDYNADVVHGIKTEDTSVVAPVAPSRPLRPRKLARKPVKSDS